MSQTAQHEAKVNQLELELAQAKADLELQKQQTKVLSKGKEAVGSLASTSQIHQAETHLHIQQPLMLEMLEFQSPQEEEQPRPAPRALDIRYQMEQEVEDMPKGPAKEYLLYEKKVIESAALAFLQPDEQIIDFGHDFLPLPLMHHEAIRWKEKMRPAVPQNEEGGYEAPAYDMEADVPLPSHMHGTSQMPDEYMRLLHKSDPKSYHKLKKQYEMDFDKVHEEYNDNNDMDDNDMDEFINDWQFLPEDHSLRRRSQARHFNGKVESGQCPIAMTPMDWYKKWTEGPLIDPESELASDEDNDRGRGQSTLTPSISIWFQLEYWKDLKICHVLNPMHIFKNVGHSLWKHLTGLKDTEQARNDLKERNCKSDLWPQVDEESGRKEYAHAPWVLTPREIATINRQIWSIQTPTGYGASLQNIFTMDDSSLSNLKTHDWHNFLKHVLPLVIDGCLMTDVRDDIYRLGKLARWITSKEIDISSIAQKKRECIELLCLMEKELPTSFFDIQVHVLIHLVDEIEIAGVVSTRWMF
ncbi:hypothetical protein L7F22_024918 [Adiantum nelumboides]|nr:hypothetical protein [Adiantum nelumboides]